MSHKVLILAGDGIGPEIMREAEKVLTALVAEYGLDISVEHALVGGAAYDDCGAPLPGRPCNWHWRAMPYCSAPSAVPNGLGWRGIYGLSAVRCCLCVRNLPCLPT